MKDDKPQQKSPAEQDVLQVLQAEQDAELAVRNCENEAGQIIIDAHVMVQRINVRTDQRISDMEMRHSHKLNKLVRDIEKTGAEMLDNDAARHYDGSDLKAVLDTLAIELCLGKAAAGSDEDAKK
jgi:vacuolar-type H+-ATPase subunit H